MESSKITGKYRVAVYRVDYQNASWRYVITSMIGYAVQPVVLPIMILFSKLIKRPVEFLPYDEDATKHVHL